MRNLPTHAALMLAVALALSGCSESPSVSSTAARAVKVEKVASHDGATASLVGVVRATNKTDLSFVEAGLVDKVLVDVGQPVKRGQVLATLERTVQAAALRATEAERKAAQSALTAQEREMQRQEALHQAGEASDATLASAKASLAAAGSPPFSRTLTRRPIEAMRSVHVKASQVQCRVQAWRGGASQSARCQLRPGSP